MSDSSQQSYRFSLEVTQMILDLLRRKDIDMYLSFPESLQVEVKQFILHHGLTSFLYNLDCSLDHHGLFRQTLRNQYYALTIRNTQLFATYYHLVELFKLNSIRFIPLKGVFLLPVIYHDISGRCMSDIDLLICSTDYQKCKDIIQSIGGTQEGEILSEFLNELGHDYPAFSLYNTTIEIHSRLFPVNVKYNIPIEEVWINLDSYPTEVEVCQGLEPYLLICYLALHIYYSEKRGQYRLYWYLDIKKVLDSVHFKQSEFQKRLDKFGIENPVMTILAKVSFIFDMDIVGIKPLTEIDKAHFIQQLSLQTQHNTDGYSVALERLLYTKGLLNKIKFINHSLRFGGISDNRSFLFHRFAKLLGRSYNYLFRSILSCIKK